MVVQNTQAQRDLADGVGIGVDDGVGHRLADGGFNVIDLLQCGIELGGKAGRGGAGKALVGGAAGKFQCDLIVGFHYVSFPSFECDQPL